MLCPLYHAYFIHRKRKTWHHGFKAVSIKAIFFGALWAVNACSSSSTVAGIFSWMNRWVEISKSGIFFTSIESRGYKQQKTVSSVFIIWAKARLSPLRLILIIWLSLMANKHLCQTWQWAKHNTDLHHLTGFKWLTFSHWGDTEQHYHSFSVVSWANIHSLAQFWSPEL